MWRQPCISRRLRRYSYAVKTELVKICVAAAALLAIAAVQDVSPAVFGAKPPFLLLFGCIAGVPAAIGAGLFTDALSGLPFGCSAVFFLVSALAVRFMKPCAFPATVLCAALYQAWLAMWGGETSMQSAYAAAVYAAILQPAMHAAFRSVKRHAGIEFDGGDCVK